MLAAGLLGLATAACAPQQNVRPAEAQFSFASAESAAQYHVLAGEMAAQRDQPVQAVGHFLSALDYVPDAELASRATRIALIARDEPLALVAARRWQALDPENATAREAATRLALRAGEFEEARRQCENLIRQHAGGPAEGFREVALLLSNESGMTDEALRIMDGLRAQWPDLAGAWYADSLLALRFGQMERAEQSAREAVARQPDAPESRLLLVGILLRKGELEEADRNFADLLDGHDKPVELRLGYARLLLEAEQTAAARAQFEAVLAVDPSLHEARYALGLLELERQEPEAAEPHFRALLEAPALKQQAMYYLGRIKEVRNRPQQAIEWYRQVTQGEQAIDAAIRQGVLLGRLGQVQEGRLLLTQMRLQLPSLSTRFYLAEGELLLNANAGNEALALYNTALDESPDDDDLLYGRSLAHERLNDLPAAEADLRQLIERDPDDARALNALGYMLTVHTRRFDEARALIVRALELTPEDAAVIDSMGWIEFRMGNVQEARHWLERAFSKMKDPEIAAHLGEVLYELGEKEEAWAIWNQALETDPEHRVLKETVERFSK
jgi:tetratricopeptide (TPR) repeat protein